MKKLSEKLRTVSSPWESEKELVVNAAAALDVMEVALEFYADPFDYIKRHNLDEQVPDFYDEMDTAARAIDALTMVRKLSLLGLWFENDYN